MVVEGTVRFWLADEGWGVIDVPEAGPEGCFTHGSVVRMPGYRSLKTGARVRLQTGPTQQPGFRLRATAVWPAGVEVGSPDPLGVPVRVLRPGDLTEADPTPGMRRRLAFEQPLLWAGQVQTEPGSVSGWHHHDINESSLYVVSGVLRLEFGGHPGWLDAVAGDFVHVPAFTVHRESNPTDQPSVAVIARAGGGIPTVNVEQPPAPHG